MPRSGLVKHGEYLGGKPSPEARCWINIHSRCYNKIHWKNYGCRGIGVCARWHRSDPNGLTNFIHDVGRRPTPEHTIERINNDWSYMPSNVTWATIAEQNNNQRRNRRITIGPVTLNVRQWATLSGVKKSTLRARLDRGCSIEDAFNLPT